MPDENETTSDPYSPGGRLAWIASARRRRGRPRKTIAAPPPPSLLISFPVPLKEWGAVVVPRDIDDEGMEMLDLVVAAVRGYAKRNTELKKGPSHAR